jgi:prevent-host-death family protein
MVKTVLISEFKAKCIKMLKEVQKNGKPLTVTLRGKPIVRVEPISNSPAKKRRLGALKGWMEIRGDIIRSDMEKDWLVWAGMISRLSASRRMRYHRDYGRICFDYF